MRKLFLLLIFALPTYAHAEDVCFDSLGCLTSAKLEETLQIYYRERDQNSLAVLKDMTAEERASLPPGAYESLTNTPLIEKVTVARLLRTNTDVATQARDQVFSLKAKWRGASEKAQNVGEYATVFLNVTRKGGIEEQVRCAVKANRSKAAVFVECANVIQTATVSYASLGLATPVDNM